jgi:hypothetical protein
MLPFGNYSDGSVGFAWPQSLVDSQAALQRFGSGQAPQPQDAVLAGLAMAGSGLGHLGLRGRLAGSVAGAERAEASSGLPSIGAEAGRSALPHPDWFSGSKIVDNNGAPLRLYHGTKTAFDEFDINKAGANDEGLAGKGIYFTHDPEDASRYALSDYVARGDAPNVIPAHVSMKNPLVITHGVLPDGRSIRDLNGGTTITAKGGNAIRELADAGGHDGIVFADRDGSVRHAVAYQPGSVRSATTGDTLFSNPKEGGLAGWAASMMGRKEPVPSALPSHSVEAGSPPVRAYHSTYADFDKFDKTKSDEFGVHFGTPDQVNSRLVEKGGLEKRDGFENARVLPVDLQIKNPLDVRDLPDWSPQDLAQQLRQNGVRLTREELSTLNRANNRTSNAIIENALDRAGYDALRYQNLSEGAGNSYAVWKPGTVKSATTGETLFSNPPDAAPAGLLATGEGEHHSRAQPRNPSGKFVTPDSFDGKLHSFRQVLVDLDGDGVPDAVLPKAGAKDALAPEPTNALAAMRGR